MWLGTKVFSGRGYLVTHPRTSEHIHAQCSILCISGCTRALAPSVPSLGGPDSNSYIVEGHLEVYGASGGKGWSPSRAFHSCLGCRFTSHAHSVAPDGPWLHSSNRIAFSCVRLPSTLCSNTSLRHAKKTG